MKDRFDRDDGVDEAMRIIFSGVPTECFANAQFMIDELEESGQLRFACIDFINDILEYLVNVDKYDDKARSKVARMLLVRHAIRHGYLITRRELTPELN